MPIFEKEGDKAFLKERMKFPNAHRAHEDTSRSVGEIDRALSWKDFEWLTKQTSLPIVCKGVMCVKDALLAKQYGASAIIVGNHGCRQFDAGPSPLLVLREVTQSVDLPVLYDSGIRSGTHVAKALALGALAVLVGRPIMWGLASNGAEGAGEVITILRKELEYDMMSLGCSRIRDLHEHLL